MDQSDFENALRERCPTLAEPVLAALQPCLLIDAERTDDVPLGASRLGGDPDLPRDLEWPAWEHGPLDFLAQLDLTEVDAAFGLPATGSLLFFADFERCLGLQHSDRDGFRVIWTRDELERRTAPDGATRYACGRVRFREHASVPPSDVVDVGGADVPDEEFDALHDLREAFGVVEVHQLFGHADLIQHPVEDETVQAITGVRGERSFDRDKWEQVKDQAREWRLLLQIASDGNLDYMWGDVGVLYFAIRRDALDRPGPENTWYVFQCS
jgi:uncharacterized protein YwqG